MTQVCRVIFRFIVYQYFGGSVSVAKGVTSLKTHGGRSRAAS